MSPLEEYKETKVVHSGQLGYATEPTYKSSVIVMMVLVIVLLMIGLIMFSNYANLLSEQNKNLQDNIQLLSRPTTVPVIIHGGQNPVDIQQAQQGTTTESQPVEEVQP